jgi:hypothetical protein
MHTRSKRYIRRHRARLQATQRRVPRKSVATSQGESRLPIRVAVGMRKLGLGVGFLGPIATLLNQPHT